MGGGVAVIYKISNLTAMAEICISATMFWSPPTPRSTVVASCSGFPITENAVPGVPVVRDSQMESRRDVVSCSGYVDLPRHLYTPDLIILAV